MGFVVSVSVSVSVSGSDGGASFSARRRYVVRRLQLAIEQRSTLHPCATVPRAMRIRGWERERRESRTRKYSLVGSGSRRRWATLDLRRSRCSGRGVVLWLRGEA